MFNASREYTSKDVKERIEHQKTVYNWQFEFLAADQDAFATGEDFGIDHDYCRSFSHDQDGVEFLCEHMNYCMDAIRRNPRKK